MKERFLKMDIKKFIDNYYGISEEFDPCYGACLNTEEDPTCSKECFFYHEKGECCLIHEFLKSCKEMEEWNS